MSNELINLIIIRLELIHDNQLLHKSIFKQLKPHNLASIYKCKFTDISHSNSLQEVSITEKKHIGNHLVI